MVEYIRVCRTVNSKGDMLPFTGLEDIVKRTRQAPNSDWYVSLFKYKKDAYDYFKQNDKIKGFSGEASSSELVFDLDSKADPDKSRLDCVTLLDRLKELGVNTQESCKIFFSGNKGYHMFVNIGTAFSNKQIKNICSNLAKDLETFDPVVYNVNRIIRIENTKHQVSGLYKIQLTESELRTKDTKSIKSLADSIYFSFKYISKTFSFEVFMIC